MSTLGWRQLAQLNRTTDTDTLAREAAALAGRGLSERDIADALRLDAGAVRRLLAMDAKTAAATHRAAWCAR